MISKKKKKNQTKMSCNLYTPELEDNGINDDDDDDIPKANTTNSYKCIQQSDLDVLP